jgi:F-type H+-transporting ATPase subunit b
MEFFARGRTVTVFALAGGGDVINPDGSLVLIALLFIIFVFLLNRVLFKPIGRVLDERNTLTEGARAEARAAARRYQDRLNDYESGIRQARGESYRYLEQQRAVAVEERARIIEDAKKQAADELEKAKAEIARQAANARSALEAEARLVAGRVTQSVLGRTVGGGGD